MLWLWVLGGGGAPGLGEVESGVQWVAGGVRTAFLGVSEYLWGWRQFVLGCFGMWSGIVVRGWLQVGVCFGL